MVLLLWSGEFIAVYILFVFVTLLTQTWSFDVAPVYPNPNSEVGVNLGLSPNPTLPYPGARAISANTNPPTHFIRYLTL